jgi:hypothetical protein
MFRRLRTVAIQASQKIHLNRFKKVDPSKWPEKGYDEEGRNYLLCPRSFLYDKIDEEVNELHDAIEDNEPLENVLKEAGDVMAIAMFLADHRAHELDNGLLIHNTPRVVCLCGSTKFKEAFLQAQYEETMKGNIVLTVGFWHHAEAGITRPPLEPHQKIMLDDLHKRKIDLADEILVLNVDGYIGDSTRGEIEYATMWGKAVRYLEIPND